MSVIETPSPLIRQLVFRKRNIRRAHEHYRWRKVCMSETAQCVEGDVANLDEIADMLWEDVVTDDEF